MRPKGVVFDITGTLRYADNTPIGGATQAVEAVRRHGWMVRCLSNNPRESPEQVADALAKAGIAFAPDEILTAGTLLGDFVAEHYRGKPVFVVETRPHFREMLASRGVVVDGSADPEAVVLALGTMAGAPLPTESILRAADLMRDGVPLYAASSDTLVPVAPLRFTAASGSLISAIERIAGRQAIVVGKPSEWAARRLLASMSESGPIEAAEIVMVGDHLISDVSFGRRMGACTALVLTGVTVPWERLAVERSADAPTVVLESVAELPGWLDGLD